MAPEDENQELEQQVDLQAIVDHYTKKVGLEVVPEEDSDPDPLPSLSEALKALSIVQRFAEAQEDSTIDDVKQLNSLERKFNLKSIKSRKQDTLDHYFQRFEASKDA